MQKTICDQCGKDLTGKHYVSLTGHNESLDRAHTLNAQFCNTYQCLRDWMMTQATKYGWERHPITAAPLPKQDVNPYDSN